jgi:hypothetical protein
MVKHIDCANLYLSDEDDVKTYFCLKLRDYIHLDEIDESHECTLFKPLWEKK